MSSVPRNLRRLLRSRAKVRRGSIYLAFLSLFVFIALFTCLVQRLEPRLFPKDESHRTSTPRFRSSREEKNSATNRQKDSIIDNFEQLRLNDFSDHESHYHNSLQNATIESDSAVTRETDETAINSEDVVILTAVNYAFRSHLANLRCSLKRLGLAQRLRVVALDDEVGKWAREAGFSVSEIDDSEAFTTTEHAKFGSPAFNLLSKRKLDAVRAELLQGRNILFTDADVFWCGDAVADVVAIATKSGDDLVMQSAWPRSLLNSGFYFARANERTLALFNELLNYGGSADNDQVIFNRLMCNKKFGGCVRKDPNHLGLRRAERNPLGCRWKDTNAGVLDRQRYPTGGEFVAGTKIFYLERTVLTKMCENRDFMILHNNCILSAKKTPRFVVKGFWYVAQDGVTCTTDPAPMTKLALKQCSGYKCGKADTRVFWAEVRRKREEVRSFWDMKRRQKRSSELEEFDVLNLL